MNNKNDHPYHNFKKVLSSNIGEITSLWNVSLEDRNNCIKKGIYSYYDNNISVDNFKLASSAGRKKILQGFLDVNKSSFTEKYLYNKKYKANNGYYGIRSNVRRIYGEE